GAGVVEEVPVSGGRRASGAGVGVAGEREAGRQGGGGADLEADGRGGQLYSDAAAAGGQAVSDADRGHFFDHGAGDGGDGPGGAGDREGGGRDRDRGGARHAQVGGDGRGDVPQAAGRRAGGGQYWSPAARHRQGRSRTRASPGQAGHHQTPQKVQRRRGRPPEGRGRAAD